MEETQVKLLNNVEDLAQISFVKNHIHHYKKFGSIYIKSNFNKNAAIFNNKDIPFFPSSNYKHWVLWFIQKIKSNGIKLRNLLGLYICWSFLKKYDLPLVADMIYHRFPYAVLLYDQSEKSKVIKVALSDKARGKIISDKEALHQASQINHQKVIVPKIIYEHDFDGYNFFVQEFFAGKQLTFKDDLSYIFNHVFDFLKIFYNSKGIELKNLSENPFLNHAFVEAYISAQKNGKEVVAIYKGLVEKEKKMLWGWIHGDLTHNNILYNENQICIIDWGKSKRNYLAIDLEISNFSTVAIFNQIIKDAGIKKEDVYTLNEQFFLKKFAEMNRLVHNGIKRKTMSDGFYKWVEKQNENLVSLNLWQQ